MLCSICGRTATQRCWNCQRPLCNMCVFPVGVKCNIYCTPQLSSPVPAPAPKTKPRPKTKASSTRKRRTSSSQPAGPNILVQSTPYYTPTPPPNPAYQLPVQPLIDFDNMTPDELIEYVVPLRVSLIKKKDRERKYLDGRKVRSQRQYGGSQTSTDIALEEEQILQDKLIELLYSIEKQAKDSILNSTLPYPTLP